MDVNVDSIERMVGDNEHNKYTMLYYLLKKRRDRRDIDVAAEIRVLEDKAKATFQSENEKTKEIKYRPGLTTFDKPTNLHLKTLKHTDTAESGRPLSGRKTAGAGNPRESRTSQETGGINFKESIKIAAESTHVEQSLTGGGSIAAKGSPVLAKALGSRQTGSKKVLQKKLSIEPEHTSKHKSSKSEGKPLLSSAV